MKILFITKWLPYPPETGNPIRNYNIIRRLAKKHEIWVVSFVDDDTKPEDVKIFKEYCYKLITIPYQEHSALFAPLRAIKLLLSGTPPDLRLNESNLMQQTIQQITKEQEFDIVQIEDSFMAFYHEAVYPHKKTRTVLSLHDIGFHKYNQIYKLEPKLARRFRLWLHSRMLRLWEPNYSQRFSSCITMSELDKQRLIEKNPLLTVESIPNGIDVQTNQPLSKSLSSTQNLLFIGNMDYRPNQDAMYYFCKEIFPEIKKRNGLINLWIVGKNTSADIFALATDSIFVTGRVDDVHPFYEKTHISVIPLRAGGGTRLKILESMALGRPVISTTVGCEGLQVVDGEHLFIADNPEVFVQRIQQLFDDPKLYSRIVTNARDFVETRYSWNGIVNNLEKYYEKL
ncbi:MAG: hypothetical protein CL609_06100 [Anaerolineaceae bacterium]|nr:hypothetical protein [Anaerolineaceae bacterium]